MDVFLFYSPLEMISVCKSAHPESARASPAFNGAINMFGFNSVVWNMFSENLKLWKSGFTSFGGHLHTLIAELFAVRQMLCDFKSLNRLTATWQQFL